MSLETELKDLLKKYNATIRFDCGDYSDLHGVYNERIVVRVGGIDVVSVSGYTLDYHDLD